MLVAPKSNDCYRLNMLTVRPDKCFLPVVVYVEYVVTVTRKSPAHSFFNVDDALLQSSNLNQFPSSITLSLTAWTLHSKAQRHPEQLSPMLYHILLCSYGEIT